MAVTTDAEGVVDGGDPHGAVMPLTFGLNSAPGQVRSGLGLHSTREANAGRKHGDEQWVEVSDIFHSSIKFSKDFISLHPLWSQTENRH